MRDFEIVLTRFLIERGILPSVGEFQITEEHLLSYIGTYAEIFTRKGTNKLSRSDRRYARKLAGLTLLKLQAERGMRYSDSNAGIVYLIENPSFPDHYKIGMTIDLDRRLGSYQTYDPYRAYRVKKYEFVLDRKLTEKNFLSSLQSSPEEGEWVKRDEGLRTFEHVVQNNS